MSPVPLLHAVAEGIEDAVHGNAARNLTRIQTAHAVSEDGYAPVSIVAERIFVVAANPADIAFGDYVHSVVGAEFVKLLRLSNSLIQE